MLLLALVIILAALGSQGGDSDLAFGTSVIDWQSASILKDKNFKSTNIKPILYIFNQPWCGACNNLKAAFARAEKDAELLKLSSQFVMVNVAGDSNADFGKKYEPDGGYIPRLLFAEPDGSVRSDITHPDNPEHYAYYYKSVQEVKTGMQQALQILGGKGSSSHPDAAEL